MSETSNGSWSFSILCFAGYVLSFKGLKTGYPKNKVSIGQVGAKMIVAVTAVSTAHHADVKLVPKAYLLMHRMQVVVHQTKAFYLTMQHNELHCMVNLNVHSIQKYKFAHHCTDSFLSSHRS